MLTTEGIGAMYAGFIPILAKQIPYAIGQFTVNERCTEAIYKQMSPETKANLGPVQNLGITLGSGIVAGFAAAILSHVNFHFFNLSSLSRHTDT
jgi:solute carrier family 25 phosphate transporter 3